jgi:predicted MFS family arabinose efflux permease
VGKTIPSRMRGRYYAWRIFTGGLLALGASYIVRYVLGGGGGLAFPRNYGLLFMIGAIGISTGMGAFAFVREPADDRVRPPASVWAQLCRAWALPARDANYRGFLAGRLCLMLAEVAAPFYIIYARSAFGLPDTVVGTYILVGTLANIASTYAWGRISDTAGNRRVLLRASALGALAPLLALAALPALGPRQGGWLPTLAVGVVFALLGAARTGVNIGAPNLLLDVAPADDRPIYVGLTNTSVGIATLATALGGVLVDALGYSALFAAALALYLLAVLALSRMREPREVVERRLEQAAV